MRRSRLWRLTAAVLLVSNLLCLPSCTTTGIYCTGHPHDHSCENILFGTVAVLAGGALLYLAGKKALEQREHRDTFHGTCAITEAGLASTAVPCFHMKLVISRFDGATREVVETGDDGTFQIDLRQAGEYSIDSLDPAFLVVAPQPKMNWHHDHAIDVRMVRAGTE
jgi:hypothetical protein